MLSSRRGRALASTRSTSAPGWWWSRGGRDLRARRRRGRRRAGPARGLRPERAPRGRRDRGRAPAARALALARRGPPVATGLRLIRAERREVALEAGVADRRRRRSRATSTPSREASPATAPSIARRWSPAASSAPPRSPPVPVDREAVVGRLDLGAERARARRPRSRSGPTPCGAAPRRRRRPSRRRRSSRRARPAAARRSPAGPRRRRPGSPCSGPERATIVADRLAAGRASRSPRPPRPSGRGSRAGRSGPG